MLERYARAFDHAEESVVGERSFDASFPIYQVRKITQLRRSAGHYYAVVDNVGGEFGWGLLQYVFDGLDHVLKLRVYGFHYFIRAHLSGTRKALDKIPALYGNAEFFFEWHRRADTHLDLFGGPVAYGKIEGFFDVIRDAGVDLVARAFHGRRSDYASERYHCHIRRASTYVHDHIAF